MRCSTMASGVARRRRDGEGDASRSAARGRSRAPRRRAHAARPRRRAPSSASQRPIACTTPPRGMVECVEHGDAKRAAHARSRSARPKPISGSRAKSRRTARCALGDAARLGLPGRTAPIGAACRSARIETSTATASSLRRRDASRKPIARKGLAASARARRPGGGSMASRSSVDRRRRSIPPASIAVPGMPPWLMSLAARARPASAISGSSARSPRRRCGRRLERRLKIVERLAVGAAHDRWPRSARSPGRASKLVSKLRAGPAENGDRELRLRGAQIGMAADDRHAVGARRRRAGRRGSAPPPSSPSAQSASTTAIGRPPIAAMSERLTITPHQPANQGSAATNSLMKPSIGEQQIPVAVGDRRAIVADRDRAPPTRPSRAATTPISALAASAAAARRSPRPARRARRRPRQAAFLSATKPTSGAWHGG